MRGGEARGIVTMRAERNRGHREALTHTRAAKRCLLFRKWQEQAQTSPRQQRTGQRVEHL
jgi:hypothetical protein